MGVRRELRFKNLNDIRAELDHLEKGPVVTTGNWSFYQILHHLNTTCASSMTKFDSLKPWPWLLRRLVGPLGLRVIFKQGYLRPGAGGKQLNIQRVEGDEKAAIATLRQNLDAIEKHNGPWSEHPMLGKMNKEQWTFLTSLHMANHLGWAKLQNE